MPKGGLEPPRAYTPWILSPVRLPNSATSAVAKISSYNLYLLTVLVKEMRILRDNFSPKDFVRPVLTIGSFDGVHLGHRLLIKRAQEEAKSRRGEVVIFTFEPHPMHVLNPHQKLLLLTPLESKLYLLENLGVDTVIAYPFSHETAQKSPEAFVEEVLYRSIRPLKVIVGYNFTFGKNRGGNAETLRDLGDVFGFQVEVLPPLEVEGIAVSSSYIRSLILQAEVEKASKYLGNPFFIKGEVVHGEKLGSLLGIPTANLKVDPLQILPKGVFVVKVSWEKKGTYGGVLNIGTRPTFGGKQLSVEVHLINFSENLYGEKLLIEFVKKIRDERQFENPQALFEQIKKDIKYALEVLNSLRTFK